MSIQNVWHLRTVANTSAKACFVCYKPSPKVLITPDNKDFFHICPGHLKDQGFCSPVIDPEAEAAKKKKAEMDAEIAAVKREYEERQKKKSDKKKKEKQSPEEKEKSQDDDNDSKAKADRDAKATSIQGRVDESNSDDSYRIFALNKKFYQIRLDRMKNADLARKNRERMKDPGFFPSVPRDAMS